MILFMPKKLMKVLIGTINLYRVVALIFALHSRLLCLVNSSLIPLVSDSLGVVTVHAVSLRF